MPTFLTCHCNNAFPNNKKLDFLLITKVFLFVAILCFFCIVVWGPFYGLCKTCTMD